MDGGDGGLQGVGAEAAGQERTLDQRDAFGDVLLVPLGAVLVFQEDQFPVGEVRAARRDSCNSMRARRPATSGSGNKAFTSRPSRWLRRKDRRA